MDKPVLAAFLSVSGISLSDDEKRLLEKYNPLGITLFNRNLSSKSQVKHLVRQIKEAVGHEDIFIAADQEGGRVNRLKAAGFPDYAFQRTLGKIDNPEITEIHCRLMAGDMLSVGINFNYAPVLDIEYPQTAMVLRGRSFGSDKNLIVRHGRTVIDTYLECGICPCMKHLPGHGRAENDPHLGLPVINATSEELKDDFYPFEQLKDCPAAMTAHILLTEIDSQNPITLSAKGISQIIRGQMEYKGLLISDAVDMHALDGTILQKAQRAWAAGCDVICYCGGIYAENETLCKNGKYIENQSLERLCALKSRMKAKKKLINVDNNQNKYYTLISQYNDSDINYDATEILYQMQKGEK